MRAPFLRLYLHLVWSTWDRLPIITPSIESSIYAAIVDKCNQYKCIPLAIGGMSDHIHLFTSLSPTIPVATFVKEVKGSSSHLVTQVLQKEAFFRWQGAYGAFTVSYADIDRVISYIKNQKQHHEAETIQKDWELIE